MTHDRHLELQSAREAVRAAARAQAGIFRRRDLMAWGLTDADLQAMLRRGWLVRLRHGIYTDAALLHGASPRQVHLLHVAGSIAAADEPALAFGPTAALVHELPLPFEAPDLVHIVRDSRQDVRSMNRPSRHRLAIPSMRITSHDLSTCEAVVVEGIPTVSRVDAAVTCAPWVSFTRKVGLFDAVLWGGEVDREILMRQASTWAYLGGHADTMRALELARPGAQTYLETLSRLAFIRQGLPEPRLQVPIHDDDGLIGIVDMLWDDWRVIGEADGAIKYQSRDDLVAEKRREDRLRARGYGVVRWMMDDIVKEPEKVASRIRGVGRWAA